MMSTAPDPDGSSTPRTPAVFLSYASEDAAAAARLAAGLRAGGIEVWLDQHALRGGDAWDREIRRQIRECTLFVPLISASTHARDEGYFRLEWKLAVDRSHLMAPDKPFLVPVLIDDTPQTSERIPDRFRELHWTRLAGGDTTPAFVARIRQLLQPQSAPDLSPPPSPASTPPNTAHRSRRPAWALAAGATVVLGGLAYLGANRLPHPVPATSGAAPAPTTTGGMPTLDGAAAVAFAPPPHAIAVLPFVNLSGDKEQEYFSDGLTEEILNALAQIPDLQVSARTSAFSFKDAHSDLDAIARKLNVATILQGSVRRAEHTVRVTAQLVNAVTGFQLWSKTYDRDLGNVLKLQTEIATAVAAALQVSVLGGVTARFELGGTRDPVAFDDYLKGFAGFRAARDSRRDLPPVIQAFDAAIARDPYFALAYAGRAAMLTTYGTEVATGAAIDAYLTRAEQDARHALTLAPELPEAHLALGWLLMNRLDLPGAGQAYARALALAPGNALVLSSAGLYDATQGRFDTAIAATRRAVLLDPLDVRTQHVLADVLYLARRYADSVKTYGEAMALDTSHQVGYTERAFPLLALGDLDGARTSCEVMRDTPDGHWCLAIVYHQLGRPADAQAEFEKLRAALGEDGAYKYALIYSRWGEPQRALDALELAVRRHDTGLPYMKVDPPFDPIRQEPRFLAIQRALKFAP